MKRHLSADEFSRWMMGDHSPKSLRHVEECAECRSELAKLDSTLLAFRGSAQAWAQVASGSRVNYRAQTPAHKRPLRWMLAAAALLVLLGSVPLYRATRARQIAATAASDTLLLEQVDAEISRAVPEPMEPLVQLVSWGPGPADANENGKTR